MTLLNREERSHGILACTVSSEQENNGALQAAGVSAPSLPHRTALQQLRALPRAPPPEKGRLRTGSRRNTLLHPDKHPRLRPLTTEGLGVTKHHPATPTAAKISSARPQLTAARPLPFPQSSAAAASALSGGGPRPSSIARPIGCFALAACC